MSAKRSKKEKKKNDEIDEGYSAQISSEESESDKEMITQENGGDSLFAEIS